MPEFFNAIAPDAAFAALKSRLADLRGGEGAIAADAETVAVADAIGRVAAADVLSPEDLPSFTRSTMDGYSVRARDTFGATEGLPAYLDVVGEAPMGQAASVRVCAGQAAVAYTGGPLAQNADAVVQVERTQPLGDGAIEVLRAVAPGENAVQVGEDVRKGDAAMRRGAMLRAQDIGALAALGATSVSVMRRPRVGIVSTGDELVPPDAVPSVGQVRDINTYTIAALTAQAGGVPVAMGIIPDDFDAQRRAAAQALSDCDMLVFSAGSSVSSRDMTAAVIDSLGPPGVFVHGIAVKPGKPTIVGIAQGKPCVGLPGNPVSAMVVFDLVARPAIYLLAGAVRAPRPPTARATLTRDIASAAGREDYIPVALREDSNGALTAEPLFGKSNLIFTLARADGIVKIPMDAGGIYAGEAVDVRLFAQ